MVEDRPIDDGNHSGLPDGDEDRLRFQTLWIILSAKPLSSPGETTVSGLYRGPARHLLTRVRLVGVIGYQLNTDSWYRILRVNGLFRRSKRPNSVRRTHPNVPGRPCCSGTGMEVVSNRCVRDIDVTDWYKQNRPEAPTYSFSLGGCTTSPRDRTNCTPFS